MAAKACDNMVEASDEFRAHGRGTAGDPRQRQEALLDEAIEETFPASDPVSVAFVAPA